VIFPHYVLSNKESYFPEPSKFIPERWLKNDKESQKDIHRFVSLPFGYGRRTCIGRRFAEAELAILLSKVHESFIELPNESCLTLLFAFSLHRFSASTR
jgi:cytochrome P450 family 49 subfamily A